MKNITRTISALIVVFLGVLSFGSVAFADYSATTTLLKSGNFTVPAGVTSVTVETIGAGGGGAGGAYTYGGGGGGAGAVKTATIPVTPGQIIPYTIGTAGTAGTAGSLTVAAGNGGNGGSTSFGSSVVANGGFGGQGATAGIGNGVGGFAGGIGGTNGTNGASNLGSRTYGGNGGTTAIGISGQGSTGSATSYTAPTAGVRGAGGGAGSGWLNSNGNLGDAGAIGGNGIIIVSYGADLTAPVITILPYATSSTNQNVTVTAVTNEGTIIASSSSASIVTSGATSSATFSDNGTVTFTATDAAGNVSSKTITISNIDKVAPIITVLPYATSSTNQDVIVTATTNEGNIVGASAIASIANNGATSTADFSNNGTVTFTATDAAGNFSSRTITISNIDKVAPVITVLPYATSSTNQDVIITATTNEGTIVGTSTIASIINSGATSTADFSDNGTVTFTATDVAGNFSSRTITISNIDKIAPVITILGSNPANVQINTLYTDAGVSVTDNSGVPLTFTASSSVNTSVLGTYAVDYTSVDLAGNVATATRIVNVVDTIAPVISVPATQVFEATGTTTTPVLVQATATDNSSTSPIITYNPAGFGLGTSTVIWTATDLSGNVATATSLVVIKDTTGPAMSLIGPAVLDLSVGNTYVEQGASSTDLVDGVRPVTIFGTVNTNNVGIYTVNYISSDLSGNVSTISREVVVSAVPPVLTSMNILPLNPSVTVGEQITFVSTTLDQFGQPFATTTTWSNTNNVVGTIDANGIFTASSIGTTEITATAGSLMPITTLVTVSAATSTPTLQSIAITTPANKTVYTVGDALDITGLVVTGTYSDGSTSTEPINVSNISGFNSLVANPNEVLTITVGTSTATYTISVNNAVIPPALASISIAPLNPNLLVGATSTFVSTTLDQYGNPFATTTTWTTSSSTVGTINAAGLFTAVSAGTTTVTATAGAISTSTVVTVSNVIIPDTIPPVITMNGVNPTFVMIGSIYADAGATALDAVDGVRPVFATGTVNTTIVGTYTIVYSASDLSGNTATTSRTVNVINAQVVLINSTVEGTLYASLSTTSGAISGITGTTTIVNSTVASTTVDNSNLTNVNSSADSEIDTSNLIRCTLVNSTVIDFTGADCYIAYSYIDPSRGLGVTSTYSRIIDSIFDYSNVDHSFISTSTVTNSIFDYSTSTNSFVDRAVVDNSVVANNSYVSSSTIKGSNLNDATSTNSSVATSTVTNSTVNNSTVDNSTSTNSVITGSTVKGSTITNSTSTGSTLTNSAVSSSTLTNVVDSGSTITGTVLVNATTTDAIIDNGMLDSGTITINGTTTTVTPPQLPISISSIGTPATFTLTYTTDGNGYITGSSTQVVASGSNGSPVTAVATSGYQFVNWNDNSVANPRTDTAVSKNITVIANFAVVGGTGTSTSSDATLSNLSVSDGTLSPTFAAGILSYTDTLSTGSTNVPTITATTNDANATDTITNASALSGTSTILVTAQDGTTTETYTIDFTVSNGTGTSTPVLTSISISPLNPSISATSTQLFTATTSDQFGDAFPASITWNSTVPGVGTINSAGLFTAVSAGVTTITASAGTTSTSTLITVTSVATTTNFTLTYTTDGNGYITGSSTQVVASGSNGSPVTAVATSGYQFVNWNDNSVANPRTDTAVSKNITVIANFAVVGGTGTSTSSDATLSNLSVSDGTLSPTFAAGILSYTDTLSTGSTNVPTITATTNDANATDTITNASALSGTSTILVTAQDGTTTETYTIDFTVSNGTGTSTPVLTSISISPLNPSISATSTQLFTATTSDQFGDAFPASITWNSTVPGVGTINSAGLFTAVSAGVTTITASAGTTSTSTLITVTAIIATTTLSDLTVYNAALNAVVQANYTPASWTTYQTVVAANIVTTANTQAEVDAATAAIIAAQLNLVPNPVVSNPVSGGSVASGIIPTPTTTTTTGSSESSDNVAPVITILGANPASITVGDSYTDAGATANDNVDGNITSNINAVSSINMNVPGTYSVVYSVSDKAGNISSATRTVIVNAASSVPTTPVASTTSVTNTTGTSEVTSGTPDTGITIPAGVGEINNNANGNVAEVLSTTSTTSAMAKATSTSNAGLVAAVIEGFSNIPNKPMVALIVIVLIAMIGLIFFYRKNNKTPKTPNIPKAPMSGPKTPSAPTNLPTGNMSK
jgi:hypothetical protein